MTRKFHPADLEVCVEMFVHTFAQAPWSEAWPPELVRARLDQILQTPGCYGVIYESKRGIEAFALGICEPWHEGCHFYLKEMCVRHDVQRQGVGSTLMHDLCTQVRALGASRVYLLTAREGMAEAFYQKLGFYTSPKMILMAQRL
jgi:GNAT superfamily N-acetyltransferase